MVGPDLRDRGAREAAPIAPPDRRPRIGEDVRALLGVLEGAGTERLADLTPADARRRQAAIARLAPDGEPLERVEDVAIPAEGRALGARIYAPARDPRPMLLYLHGGGWVTGDLDIHDYRCRRLASAADCLLLSLDYRLAPEHPFPAALEDAYAALQWLGRSASDIGGRPGLLAVAGDSSGGNLAAAVTLVARDRGGPAAALQVLTCPITDRALDSPSMLEFADGYVLARDDVRWCWRHYIADSNDADHPYACPLRAPDLSGLPPALVVTAELDPLRDQGEAYARRLEQAGVPVERRRYAGMIHSFVDFEQSLQPAREAVAHTAAALRRAWAQAARAGP